ncbi:Bax inhibitor-1/YccA family protein [Breznakia pachnodae]|uniref:FtsH-binding integral membrane protein n=1 Tax=Breznakia pachnodae TaxID=265178 RepID=A0ABU0DZ62_9FIRM|nr:Bax inhibitor-1/YccA family protein [Breznakia pachnodae]MDQ0359835.1 FtsH-binding integral membrane protein [Breznakia pachnodae]
MEIYEQSKSTTKTSLQSHMTKTFLWMFAGLAVTFGVAAYINSNNQLMYDIYSSSYLWIVMMVAQFGVVIALAARITKMKPMTARILFFAYAALTGVTFSVLGLTYELGTIGLAFAMAALYFGSLAVIGFTTKRDLSKIGTIAIAALFAMIVYSFITMIFGLSMNIFVYSIIGLVVFAGLTAWDVQKMKKLYYAYEGDEQMLNNLSIYSAFELYLDFINIFLYILRILGNNRD